MPNEMNRFDLFSFLKVYLKHSYLKINYLVSICRFGSHIYIVMTHFPHPSTFYQHQKRSGRQFSGVVCTALVAARLNVTNICAVILKMTPTLKKIRRNKMPSWLAWCKNTCWPSRRKRPIQNKCRKSGTVICL